MSASARFLLVVRWTVLLVSALACLYFLKSAAFSAWMSGGPPNPYPEGWALRAKTQLLYSGACLAAGVALFRAAQLTSGSRRLTLALAAGAAVLAVAPSALVFLRVDACLDDGGRWNYAGNQCER